MTGPTDREDHSDLLTHDETMDLLRLAADPDALRETFPAVQIEDLVLTDAEAAETLGLEPSDRQSGG